MTWREESTQDDTEAYEHFRLGVIAQGRGDLDEAEGRYRKTLGLLEGAGHEGLAAAASANLGILAGDRGKLAEVGRWYARAELGFMADDDADQAAQVNQSVLSAWRKATPERRAELRAGWEAEGVPWPEGAADDGVAAG